MNLYRTGETTREGIVINIVFEQSISQSRTFVRNCENETETV